MVMKFGILGSAKIAHGTMIPAIRAAGAEAYAVASRNLDRAQVFAEENALPKAYGSYDELINDVDIDAIYVALPIHLHKEWSIKALRAGKSVLCEKSLCMTVSDAVEMYTVAQESGQLLREVMAYRFHPIAEKCQELIASGAIGDVKVVHADFHTPLREHDNIRLQKECGGGALRDLGVYCIDLNRFIFNAEPEQIVAQQFMGPTDVDETTAGILRFPNGGIAYFSCTLNTHYDCHFEISGTNGRIRCPRGAMVAWGGEEFKLELWSADKDVEQITLAACNPYEKMLEAFIAAAEAKQFEDPQMNNSVGNLRVIESVIADAQAQLASL